jgi:tetratricopeptide (TPR) repeat protein
MRPSPLREEIFALLYSRKRPELAVLRLNKMLEAEPENSEALALKSYSLNKLANESKNWEYSRAAIEVADRALRLDQEDDMALTSKGWALIDLGDAREAILCLSSAVKINPENQYTWYNLAWAEYLTGESAKSKESIKRALLIDPGNEIISQGKRMMETDQLPGHLIRLRKSKP